MSHVGFRQLQPIVPDAEHQIQASAASVCKLRLLAVVCIRTLVIKQLYSCRSMRHVVGRHVYTLQNIVGCDNLHCMHHVMQYSSACTFHLGRAQQAATEIQCAGFTCTLRQPKSSMSIVVDCHITLYMLLSRVSFSMMCTAHPH